jgi:hypothetical protein
VTTLQYVNTTVGTFTNIIEFKENPGKTKSVQVVVDGKPVNDTRINLTFRRYIYVLYIYVYMYLYIYMYK